jgi:hypothetical protein
LTADGFIDIEHGCCNPDVPCRLGAQSLGDRSDSAHRSDDPGDMPVGDANDPAKALLALARAAVANTASTLGEIAVGGSHCLIPGAVKTASGSGCCGFHSGRRQRAGAMWMRRRKPRCRLPTRMTQAVRSAAAQAAPRQAGLAPMMANLDAAIALPETPEPVRQAARAVLDKALPAGQPVTATALREAVQGSGVFLEARLARAAVTPEALVPANATEPGGDMKAALLVLRAVVSTWLAKAPGRRIRASNARAQDGERVPVEPARPVSAPPSSGYAPTLTSGRSDRGLSRRVDTLRRLAGGSRTAGGAGTG